ncbi:DNA-3-methyladenine glycosylase family protein [Gimesia chilikensis]|jgi:DNA-3-methyladenine glycosylase II|uniref:DNA-3-methyladenine glycosylase II n=1 Tax=Gimesia chilikensis TaxID=2605989 RepID=A0A517PHF9_9PLAN|nr:DNA-3-methyladenine glycosylase [Gimesia chilikensis]KAA0138270.1 DNA-3-methyladenine glycosylase 2 family protein [Gimesia chilikensis]QDT18817.1 DNA-3-methyladenine glycosylase [Gimesia chilikensis]QDU00895.1 DNA-3-methyladenine glycosylase [Gimesia chilikensis]
MSDHAKSFAEASLHLRKVDPRLKPVIDNIGVCSLKPYRYRFALLLRSIVSQQISTSAARTIYKRLHALTGKGQPSAEKIMQLSHEELRSVGLSAQKANYVHHLAEMVLEKQVRLHKMHTMTDDEVTAELVQVKGIGQWTAQMFLMFGLCRPDVFPHDDLGIQNGIQTIYELETRPDKQTCIEIAELWAPYRTVASWYCWRVLEMETPDGPW